MVKQTNLLDMLSRLIADRNAAKESLDELDTDIAAVERTIYLLSLEGERELHDVVTVASRILPEEFEGVSQMGAIEKLARLNGGVVTVSEAKRLLIETGLTKSRKYAYQAASSRLNRSNKFEWIDTATYRLKESAGTLAGEDGCDETPDAPVGPSNELKHSDRSLAPLWG